MITPTSVLPYMLQGFRPKVCSTNSQVFPSMGSPVNESFSGANRPRPATPDSRIIRYTVGAAARFVTRNASRASTIRSGLNLPE